MRLIDADGVLLEMQRQKLLAREPAAKKCMEIIKNATTYCKPPKKAAHWERNEYGAWRCSLCSGVPDITTSRYCPHCGAKMKKENQYEID